MPKSLADVISKKARALAGSPNDYDALVEMVGEARFVLLGEASHGTHEFYRESRPHYQEPDLPARLQRHRGGSGLARCLPRSIAYVRGAKATTR